MAARDALIFSTVLWRFTFFFERKKDQLCVARIALDVKQNRKAAIRLDATISKMAYDLCGDVLLF